MAFTRVPSSWLRVAPALPDGAALRFGRTPTPAGIGRGQLIMSDSRQIYASGRANLLGMQLDQEHCHRVCEAEDSRFDGWFFVGVTSTGIYCRPSCQARTPKRENRRFFASAAAAQAAGFRACKRCRPDASPGSPEWDTRADLVGRLMRLIGDGVVDREGVPGLASRVGFSERHVHRCLVDAVGAGPLALARAQRAQAARILLETTELPMAALALAAGFASVRQFNDTVREVFASTPSELRRGARRGEAERRPADGLVLRLPYRAPFEAGALLGFLGARAVPGVEEIVDGGYRRSLRLPRGAGVAELRPAEGHIQAALHLDDLRDLGPAVQRCRRLLDLDSDPQAIAAHLGGDPLIGALVRTAPGRRVPGHVDPHELAVRAVLGQQVSLAGAATLAGRLATAHGEQLARPLGGITHLFPSSSVLATADLTSAGVPASRRSAIQRLAQALAARHIDLGAGADRAEAQQKLLALPGIGPWTVSYIAMRALRDPDAFLASDLGIRRALEYLGQDPSPAGALKLAERWRPYRAAASQHLWGLLTKAATPSVQLAA
jgi:AraC family transcriptional regulator, regulatory protein of adaptative response / DNA-3-methyladenine glycosylase II